MTRRYQLHGNECLYSLECARESKTLLGIDGNQKFLTHDFTSRVADPAIAPASVVMIVKLDATQSRAKSKKLLVAYCHSSCVPIIYSNDACRDRVAISVV